MTSSRGNVRVRTVVNMSDIPNVCTTYRYRHNRRQNIVGKKLVIFLFLESIKRRKASNIRSKPNFMIGLPQTNHGFAETNAISAAIIIEIFEALTFTIFIELNSFRVCRRYNFCREHPSHHIQHQSQP